jgi:uncharacterized protein (TIGR03790 family)
VADPRAKNVLVVYNTSAPESRQIVDHYVKARGVPASNVLGVKVTATENIPKSEYKTGIVQPVAAKIATLENRIDFILLIRGVPIRLDHDYGHSMDASLMVDAHPKRKDAPLDWWAGPTRDGDSVSVDPKAVQPFANPYGGSAEAFSSDKHAMYLVSRLDAYTVAQTIRLIDNSVQAKPLKGLFLLDSAPDRDSGGYGAVQRWMTPAQDLLEKKGMRVEHDKTRLYIGDKSGVMGYAGWGSNDSAFVPSLYKSIKFAPGGIAETFVSTSGRTFRPTSGGQSLIADLIVQGATGVKGYVSEPYTFALCRVDILFDRYTSGRSLAESFWAATPLLKWKDIVIGDPLCAPYAE